MNGKNLLEGMSFIDERFVEEAETQTIRKNSIPWTRWASVAACVCVFLVGIFATRSIGLPMQQASQDSSVYAILPQQGAQADTGGEAAALPEVQIHTETDSATAQEPESYAFEASYLAVAADGIETKITVIDTAAELAACFGEDAAPASQTREAKDAALNRKYDNAFFEDQNLILVTLESCGTEAPRVTDIRRNAEGEWIIIVEVGSAAEDGDATCWNILLEIQMGNVIQPGDSIRIEYIESFDMEDSQ